MLILTLLTINILLVLNHVTNQAIGFVEDRIEVSVYFHDSTEEETVTSAVDYLRSLAQVKNVETISAGEAYERFVERHQDEPAIMDSLEELGGNPFGPTLIVKAFAAEDFDLIIEALDNPKFRDDIREKDFSDYEQIVEKIQSTTSKIRTFGVVLSLIFLFIATLIIFNTVRMGVFVHREEIGIMKLVGASNWFVRAPFILEAILLSLITVALVAILVYPTISILEPKFALYFGGQSSEVVEYFKQNGLKIFGIQLLVMIALTIISTSMAIRKYLKV